MKFCRFNDDRLGVVEGDWVADVSNALDVLPTSRWPLPAGDPFIAHLGVVREAVKDLLPHAERLPLGTLALQSPVPNPSKIIGAPVNYRTHVVEAESTEAIHHGMAIKPIEKAGLFLKANSSLCGPSSKLRVRFPERRTDHEAELVVVIGRAANKVTADHAFDYVAGYSMGLDMTVRGTEDRSFRKSVDTYAVLGPWLVTADEILNAGQLDFDLRVNGLLRQQSNTRQLIFGIPKLVEWASSFYTLNPGDLIYTGTPEGVGPIEPGDHIEMTMQGIGSLVVDVIAN